MYVLLFVCILKVWTGVRLRDGNASHVEAYGNVKQFNILGRNSVPQIPHVMSHKFDGKFDAESQVELTLLTFSSHLAYVQTFKRKHVFNDASGPPQNSLENCEEEIGKDI